MTCQVYLYHFETPWHHAQHYLGVTKHLHDRFWQHCNGKGSPLVKAVVEAGILVHLAETWDVETWSKGRALERHYKKQKNSRKLCPICKASVKLEKLFNERKN